ncbi:MAG: glycine zipper 2TM domain-containing protein [Pseudomonadota bacterium]
MNTPLTHPVANKHHPMMIIAAIAIILFCLAGTAAIMGWIPSSIGGTTAKRGDLTEADRLALAAQMQAPSQQLAALPPLPAPQPAPLAVRQPEPAPVQQYQRAPAQNYAPAPNYAPESAPRAPARQPVQLAAAAPAKNWCSNCGNVESVREIKTRAEGSGVGAAGGAILGGLLGNQIGGGHGRQLATVAGAVGGAVVGNQVEGNMKATSSYEIRVRLDDGKTRTFHQQRAPAWRSGDRVRVVKGVLRSVR